MLNLKVPEGGEAPRPEDLAARMGEMEREVGRLRVALEDVITLAHTSGEARSRVAQMERRAMAALAGRDQEPPTRPHELARIPRDRARPGEDR